MRVLADGVYIGIGLGLMLFAFLLIVLDEVWQWIRMSYWWVVLSLWKWGMIAWSSTGGRVLHWRRRRRALREIERLIRDDLFLRNRRR